MSTDGQNGHRIPWRRGYLYAAFFLLAVLPAGFYLYSTRRTLDRQRERQALQGESQLASLSAALLQEHFQQGIAFLQAYASRDEFRQSWQAHAVAEVTGYLKEAHSLQPDFISFQVFDFGGTLRAIYPPDPSLMKVNFASQDWYRGISRDWNPYVSELFQAAEEPYPLVVAVAVPLRDTKGRPIGILMAPYALGKVADWLSGIKQQSNRAVSLVDQRGHLARFPSINGAQPVSEAGNYEPVRRLLDGKAGAEVFWRQDSKFLVAYEPIPAIGWGILAEEPAASALQTTRVAEARLLVFGLMFVALTMGCGVLLASLFRRLRRTEEKLGESGERYRLIFDNSPQPLLLYDVETLAILDVNDAATRRYGHSREEFQRLKLSDIRPPEDVSTLPENLATRQEGTHVVNARHNKKDGAIMDVELYSYRFRLAGRPTGLVLVNDITERKRAERALRQSEERFRLLVERVNDYAIFTLDPSGRVTSWSAAAERIKGYRADEILGKHFSCFYPPDDLETDQPGMALRMAGEVGRCEEEGWRVRHDGSRFWANVVMTALRDPQGKLVGFWRITRDLTERKLAEDRMRDLNQHLKRQTLELEAANKDLEAFTYSVSHDLRAPLRQIGGFSKILARELDGRLEPQSLHYLHLIQEGTRRMGLLIDDLLQLSRIGRQDVHRQITGLKPIVDEVLEDLQQEIASRDVEWRIGDLPFVECDPGLIKQVFANLLSNGVKFTRPREHAVIEVGATTKNGQPVFWVRDNGVGFSMKYADKLFGVFQRLHRQKDFEGTGVGLAIVQRIIQKHGGRIWVQAESDRGACFYFTLGKADEDAAENVPSAVRQGEI